jgi:chromosome segregation ATPase
MSKNASLEKHINTLTAEKKTLESKLFKTTELHRVNEIELEKAKNTIREKDFEIEQLTTFYHKTLEDFAIAVSELETIKDSSTENMQRLRDQISELSLELSLARRKSRGFTEKLSAASPFKINGKSSIGIVETLISDLSKRLKSM